MKISKRCQFYHPDNGKKVYSFEVSCETAARALLKKWQIKAGYYVEKYPDGAVKINKKINPG